MDYVHHCYGNVNFKVCVKFELVKVVADSVGPPRVVAMHVFHAAQC